MAKRTTVPASFASVLWAHNVARVDPTKHRKLLIVQAMNYGTLEQLRWLQRAYGRDGIRRTLARVPDTALRPRARRLARALFGATFPLHARRRTH
ncbi:hypothetical protein HY480_01380 [Candidatus Uhrbacteria bacterium]|nr:hypothetical protein [Candidatus Uhrbacteria bacterium]